MPSTLPTESPTKTSPPSVGTLFVVATPIGHMEDITFRAVRTLKDADLIAAEDTRRTRKLLTRYDISTPVVSCHDHNQEKRTPDLLRRLRSGASIALVTDAGTPAISDPGFHLIKEAAREAVPVVPIPGASAAIAALSVSGLPSDSFVFIGFVPRKSGKRRQLLETLKQEPRTLVFYESPKRLLGLLKEILEVMGERQVVVARELTKIHEEVFRAGLGPAIEEMSARPALKGECTLLVAGCGTEKAVDRESVRKHLERILEKKDCSLSDLAKRVAGEYGLTRKEVYDMALELKREDGE